MKKLIILLVVLVGSVAGKAQSKDSSLILTTTGDYDHSKGTGTLMIIDSCCTVPVMRTNCFGSDSTIKFNTRGDYGHVKERGALVIYSENPTTIPSCHLDSIIKSLEKRIEVLEKMFIPNTYVDLKHLETNLSRF